MCIRDSYEILMLLSFSRTGAMPMKRGGSRLQVHPTSVTSAVCLLYTSPSPRDRTLSSSSAASDVYKRQLRDPDAAVVQPNGCDADEAGRLALASAPDQRDERGLSLIHISEPTRPYTILFVGSVRCV